MDISTNRGRGPNVPGNVNAIIAEVYIEDRNQTAKEVMGEVHRRLQKLPYVQLRPGWPGLSYIQKALIKFIKTDRELPLDPEDRPWSVAALADYDIRPETLLVVMKAWARELERDTPLTIREAKWIARLYCVYPNLKDLPKVSHFDDISFAEEDVVTITARDVEEEILYDIIQTARGYANQERAIKLTGTYPHNPQDAVWLWSRDAGLYHAVTGDMRILEKCLKLLKPIRKKLSEEP